MITKNTKKFEFTLGRLGLILFILCMSGLLFGVFLFGVIMGKNIDTYPEKIAHYLPEKLKTRLGLPSGLQEQGLAMREERNQDAPAPDEEPGLTYFNTLGKGKTDAGAPPPQTLLPKKSPAGGAGEQPAPPVQIAPRPDAPKAVPDPANPAAHRKAPAKNATAPIPKDAPAKAGGIGQQKYIVQVVSYHEKEKADALVKKISSLGYPARIEVMELPGKGKWFRVLMGNFSGRAEADKAIMALSKSNKGLNCVVRPVEGK